MWPFFKKKKQGAIPNQFIRRNKVVSDIVRNALDLQDTIKGIKTEMWDTLLEYLREDYEQNNKSFEKIKNNLTLYNADKTHKLRVDLSKARTIDPVALAQTKEDIAICLKNWTTGAANVDAIQDIVTRAFQTDAAGNVNRWRVMLLLSIEVDDPLWNTAMEKLRKSDIVTGITQYLRFYIKDEKEKKYKQIRLNFSSL